MTRKSDVKFDSLRKQRRQDGSLLFPDCKRFNLEDKKRKGLKPHAIGATLADDPTLAPLWQRRLSVESDGGLLDDIFEVLREESEPDSLESELASRFGLDGQTVKALSALPLSV